MSGIGAIQANNFYTLLEQQLLAALSGQQPNSSSEQPLSPESGNNTSATSSGV